MFSQKLKRFALLGGFAAAGLVFGPMAASADVNKCGKDVTKNNAKITTDVQKELAKCVDGWLKDEDKVAANIAKGLAKTPPVSEADSIEAGASKGLIKAALKCQKSLAKIGVVGVDMATIDGVTEKGKLGKSFNKLKDATGLGTAGKHKCGPKTFDVTAVDEELGQLGLLSTATFGDLGLRIIVGGAFGQGWDTQVISNGDSHRVFGAMAENRCGLSGVACDSDLDCPGLKGVPETCDVTGCPDCLKFGRAANTDLGPGGTFHLCNASTTFALPGTPCAGADPDGGDESICGGVAGITDFCDSTPPGGSFAGPAAGTQCISGGVTATNLEAYLNGPTGGTFFCDETVADLGGTGFVGPAGAQCDPTDVAPIGPNFPAPVTVSLNGTSANQMIDVAEILPGGIATSGGPARGIVATLILGAPIDVCVDSLRNHGFIATAAGAGVLPRVDVAACGDIDIAADTSGAPGVDACSTFTRCTETEIPLFAGVFPAHTAKTCQDITVSVTPSVAGDSAAVNLQRTTIGSCADVSLSPGTPGGNLLTTGEASGDAWDVGPTIQLSPGAGGQPSTDAGARHFIAGPANAPFTGTPYDLAALAQGRLEGGTLVGSFASAQDDATQLLGHTLTTVLVECIAP